MTYLFEDELALLIFLLFKEDKEEEVWLLIILLFPIIFKLLTSIISSSFWLNINPFNENSKTKTTKTKIIIKTVFILVLMKLNI